MAEHFVRVKGCELHECHFYAGLRSAFTTPVKSLGRHKRSGAIVVKTKTGVTKGVVDTPVRWRALKTPDGRFITHRGLYESEEEWLEAIGWRAEKERA